MFAFLKRNMGTIIVLAILLLVLYKAIKTMIADKKAGKCSCGGNCSSCAGCTSCSSTVKR